MSDAFTEDDLRKALFVTCQSKADLHNWITCYLGLELPDCVVDADSTASPMDVIWEIYDAALKNERTDISRLLAYSARDAFKTVLAAILEVLAVMHLERNTAHLAAIESQASKAQRYVRDYFARPFLREYVTMQNVRRIEITHYLDPGTGNHLTKAQHDDLLESDKTEYIKKENYIQILVATLQGTNCIDPMTLIRLPDGTEVIASDVAVGQSVCVFDLREHRWDSARVASVRYSRKQSMEVVFDQGSVILSEDHPVLTTRGWIRARALRVTDLCLPPEDGTASAASTSIQVDEASVPSIDDVEQMILGSLLGDASLTWPKDKNKKEYGSGPRFQVYHGKDQIEYLKKKKEVLARAGIDSNLWYDKRGGAKLMTRVLPSLAPLYRDLYPGGTKTISAGILSRLKPEGMAYWFMDDGSGNAFVVGSRKSRRVSLATCCFSSEENHLIATWLTAMGFESKVGAVSNQTGKKWPVIELTLDSSRRLSAYLDKWIVPELRYKFPPAREFLDTRCIETGEPITVAAAHGFSRSKDVENPSPGAERQYWTDFRAMFTRKVVSLKFLGSRMMVDISIDTKDEMRRNFIANSSVLLHNSEHVNFMVIDEVDVIENPRAYQEAKLIPSPFAGKMPITLLISTRKTSFGLVQQEIDQAPKTKLLLRRWNIIDVAEACPPSRHRPDEEKVTLYRSDEELNHYQEEEYNLLDERTKAKYVKHVDAWAGCATCPIFSSCKTRLVDKQASTSPLLKPIGHVINLFREVSLESAQAQLMSRKAATTGLIYPRYDPDLHLITATQMAEKIVGVDQAPGFVEKGGLIQLMLGQGLDFYAGADWGYTHEFVVASGAICGLDFFIFDVIAVSGLDPEQKLEASEKVKLWNPTIFADPESPDSIKLFKKKGFNMRSWKKGPGSVAAGIDVTRMKLRPSTGTPQLYFLRGDPGCELAADRISKYHFTMDAAGEPTDVPSDDKDDIPDAVRYVVMNLFTPKGRITVSEEARPAPGIEGAPDVVKGPTEQNYLGYFINQHLGEENGDEADQSAKRGKKGKIIWSMD